MNYVIAGIGIISFLLAVYSFWNYVSHPLAFTGRVTYTGGKFWIVALIALALLYLKGN